jgi:hypothetical protein
MTYTIINDLEKTSEIFHPEGFENIYCEVLNYLGYYLSFDNSSDNGDVKEYNLMDSNDDKILSFFESWFENACLYALTDLGYSVEEGDLLADKIVQVSF